MRRKRYVMKSYVAIIVVCIMSLGVLLGNSVPVFGAEIEVSDAIRFISTKMNAEGALVLTWQKDEDITVNHLMREDENNGGYVIADELMIEEGKILDSGIISGESVSYLLEGERSNGDTVHSFPIHIVKKENYVYKQVLFDDDFTDSDVTSDSWTVESGNWTVSNGLLEDEGGSTEQLMTAGSDSWADYSFTVDMVAISNSWPFMMMHYQDASNFYFLQAQFSNNQIILGKRVGGEVTEYPVNYNMTMGQTYRFKVEMTGNQIRGYVVDGNAETLLIEETFTEFDSGRIGLRNKWVSANFDRVSVDASVDMMNESELAVADVSTDVVTLEWQSVQGATSYRLYRKASNEEAELIYEGMDTSYTDNTVQMNTTYDYYLNYDVVGFSAENSESLTVTTDVEIPEVVSSVVTYPFSDAIRIEWGAVEGASLYHVYGSDTYDGTFNEIYSGINEFYVEEGLESGELRYYKVTAENTAGESSPSAIVEGTTRTSQMPFVAISGSPTGYIGDAIQWRVDTDLSMVNYKIYRQDDGKMIYIDINRGVVDQQLFISLQTDNSLAVGDYVIVVGNSEAADTMTITLQSRSTPPSGDSDNGGVE